MLRRSLLAAAVALASFTVGGMAQPAPVVQVNAPRKPKRGLFGGYYASNPGLYGTKGAGISMAQQKRASRKRRNVARHRAVSRR